MAEIKRPVRAKKARTRVHIKDANGAYIAECWDEDMAGAVVAALNGASSLSPDLLRAALELVVDKGARHEESDHSTYWSRMGARAREALARLFPEGA